MYSLLSFVECDLSGFVLINEIINHQIHFSMRKIVFANLVIIYIEELKQIPISEIEKEINSETSLEFAYKDLGNPKDHIDYFNEEDYAVLQQRLAELQK